MPANYSPVPHFRQSNPGAAVLHVADHIHSSLNVGKLALGNVIPACFWRESRGPTGALHRMCQRNLPIVSLDARQKRSGMTFEQSI
jgi:hypothetical protein